MIIEKYDKSSKLFTQRVRYKTLLFGREYFWLTDIDGTWYLLKSEDGKPVFV